MVKNKKMSKTSIAVIVLAVLLVLSLIMGLTGAWFTGNASDKSGAQVVRLGQWGNISLEATGAVWQEHPEGGALDDVDGRAYVMPGDKVQSDTVTVTWTPTAAGENASVYYLMKINNDYKLINGSGAYVNANNAAGTITAGTPLEVEGMIALLDVVSGEAPNQTHTYYALDGVLTGTGTGTAEAPKHSWEIAESFGANANIAFAGQAYGANGAAVQYKVAVIQIPNLSESDAYTKLVTILDGMADVA